MTQEKRAAGKFENFAMRNREAGQLQPIGGSVYLVMLKKVYFLHNMRMSKYVIQKEKAKSKNCLVIESGYDYHVTNVY